MAKGTRGRGTKRHGFTLIEVMVVITIIGMMSAIVAVSVFKHLVDARKERVGLDFKSLDNSISIYRMRTGRLPESLDALLATHDLKESPRDPWERPYVYERAQNADGYRLTTLGADGQTGGEGEDADLHSDDPRPEPR